MTITALSLHLARLAWLTEQAKAAALDPHRTPAQTTEARRLLAHLQHLRASTLATATRHPSRHSLNPDRRNP